MMPHEPQNFDLSHQSPRIANAREHVLYFFDCYQLIGRDMFRSHHGSVAPLADFLNEHVIIADRKLFLKGSLLHSKIKRLRLIFLCVHNFLLHFSLLRVLLVSLAGHLLLDYKKRRLLHK